MEISDRDTEEAARGSTVLETENHSSPQTERNLVCVSENRTYQFSTPLLSASEERCGRQT